MRRSHFLYFSICKRELMLKSAEETKKRVPVVPDASIVPVSMAAEVWRLRGTLPEPLGAQVDLGGKLLHVPNPR